MTRTVLFVCAGTRGDGEPLANLAHCLSQKGHRVVWSSVPSLTRWGRMNGLDTVELPPGASELYEKDEFRDAGALNGNPIKALRSLRSYLRAARVRYVEMVHAVWKTFDALAKQFPNERMTVVLGGLSVFWLYPVFQALNVRVVFASFQPLFRTHGFSHPLAPDWVPRIFGLSWASVRTATWSPWKSALRKIVLEGGIEPYADRRNPWESLEEDDVLWLVPIPQSVLPRPNDWPSRVVQTSSWVASSTRNLDSEIVERIQSARARNRPVLYVGFGSGAMLYPGIVTQFDSVCRELGVELVAQTDGDWNHSQLFPLCDAAIHHGGAGTFFQALRSSIPQAVIWQASDSYFWARRVFELGLGPLGCSGSKWTRNKLKRIVASILSNSAYRENALKVAASASFGCESAADAMASWWEGFESKRPEEAPANKRLKGSRS